MTVFKGRQVEKMANRAFVLLYILVLCAVQEDDFVCELLEKRERSLIGVWGYISKG